MYTEVVGCMDKYWKLDVDSEFEKMKQKEKKVLGKIGSTVDP